MLFFFNDTATTEIYTLSLHDALPIWALCLDEPSFSERPLQRLRHEQHRRPVRAPLRLLHEQQPVEQLDRLLLVEEAVVDQPRGLVAREATQGGPLRLLHDGQGGGRETGVLGSGGAGGGRPGGGADTS